VFEWLTVLYMVLSAMPADYWKISFSGSGLNWGCSPEDQLSGVCRNYSTGPSFPTADIVLSSTTTRQKSNQSNTNSTQTKPSLALPTLKPLQEPKQAKPFRQLKAKQAILTRKPSLAPMWQTSLAAQTPTLDTRVPDTVVTGIAGISITLEDMAVGAGRVDGLVAAELVLGPDALAVAGGAGFFLSEGYLLVCLPGYNGGRREDVRRGWPGLPGRRRGRRG
jgi:hypothetical protein